MQHLQLNGQRRQPLADVVVKFLRYPPTLLLLGLYQAGCQRTQLLLAVPKDLGLLQRLFGLPGLGDIYADPDQVPRGVLGLCNQRAGPGDQMPLAAPVHPMILVFSRGVALRENTRIIGWARSEEHTAE